MGKPRPPRTELWFRKVYRPFFEDRSITTIVRPFKRSFEDGDVKAHQVGETLTIRIIDQVGADWAEVWGTLIPDVSIPVIAKRIRFMKVNELQPDDFEGMPPDTRTEEQLRYHLGAMYNLDHHVVFDPAFEITVTDFSYLE